MAVAWPRQAPAIRSTGKQPRQQSPDLGHMAGRSGSLVKDAWIQTA
ncbi:hypothetical protein ABIE00_003128 [Arthrobacter sp. OAP107]